MEVTNAFFKKMPAGATVSNSQIGMLEFELDNIIQLKGIKVFKNNKNGIDFKLPEQIDTRGAKFPIFSFPDNAIKEKIFKDLREVIVKQLNKVHVIPKPLFNTN